MHRETDWRAMDQRKEDSPPMAPKPVRRKIPPPVPPRTHSLIQNPGPSSTVSPYAIGHVYTNIPRGKSRRSTSPRGLRRVAPSMDPSGECTPTRYYGKHEAIDLVMEDITNMDISTAATRTVGRPIKKYQLKREQMANESSGVGQHWRTVKEASVSTSTTPSLSPDKPPTEVVYPVPKPRIHVSARSTPDSDDSQSIQLPPPISPDFDVVYTPTKEISLMERIIKSHPIWYLMQDINRETAALLLSDAHPGNFIVRPSSKPRCAALSVRVLQSSGKTTHHFVIEPVGIGKVRLMGSRMAFASLPSLIEFYHQHGGELQCQLRLPQTILELRTVEEIVQIANVGPAFWNSHYTHTSTFRPMANEASTSFISTVTSTRPLPDVPAIQHKRANSSTTVRGEASPLTRGVWPRTSDHTPHYYDSNQWELNPASAGTFAKKSRGEQQLSARLYREASLNGHTSRRDQANETTARPSRRSQSVRDAKPKEPGRKKSFFKSFFGHKEGKKRAGTPDLAHCTAFQVDQDAIKRSYGSAFEIGEPKIKTNGFGKAYPTGNGVPTMRTFKPLPGEITNIGRPLPPKPFGDNELSSPASALRLARHNEGSPGPTRSPEARKAMKPPGTAIDLQSKQSCLEELRRKRLQSQNEMLNASPTLGGSPKPQHRMNERFYRSPVPLRSPKKDHRLSVPDLLDFHQPSLAQESGRALRERLGRNEVGELGPINEGLITPVVRRKQFPIRHEIPHENDISSSTTDGSDTYGEQKPRSESNMYGTLNNNVPRQPGYPSPSVQRKESELIWRRNSAKKATVPEPPAAPRSNRSGCIFPDRTGASWTAVANELTARQAAKRRSQNMNLTANVNTVIPVPNKIQQEPSTSDYTPLSDLNDFNHEKDRENIDDDAVSVAGTIFNEPWDSNTWDNLIDLAHHKDEGMRRRYEPLAEEQENEVDGSPKHKHTNAAQDPNISWDNASQFSTLESRRKPLGTMRSAMETDGTPLCSMMSLPRARSRHSHCDFGSYEDVSSLVPVLSPFSQPPEVSKEVAESNRVIQDYIEHLAADATTFTGRSIKEFLTSLITRKEEDSAIIIRDVRQFVDGFKNFFIKQGEKQLHSIFAEQRLRLTANQILNYDAIMETIMHKIVFRPLKSHLYRLKIDDIQADGILEAITRNILGVREYNFVQYGFDSECTVPPPQVMEEVKYAVKRMQYHYSPLKKLESMLKAIGILLKSQRAPSPDKENNPKIPPIDQVIRWFVYLIARTSMVGCEIEVWYMMELLPRQIHEQGDAFYYLTAMMAATHLLKSEELLKKLSQKEEDLDHMATLPRVKPAASSADMFIKVAVPNIILGNIKYYTFPALPQVPSIKLCRVIAHQLGITNAEVYGMYIIMDGYETPVQHHETIDLIRNKLLHTGKNFFFAYKQHDAKIAWPGPNPTGLAVC